MLVSQPSTTLKNKTTKPEQTDKDSHGFVIISADLSSRVVILVWQLVVSLSTAANGDVHTKAISVFSLAVNLGKGSQVELELALHLSKPSLREGGNRLTKQY